MTDLSLEDPDLEMLTNGNSFMNQRQRKVQYFVVFQQQILQAKLLLPGASIQKAEIIVLTFFLLVLSKKRESKSILILTKYVCNVLWKEKAFLL